jgi:integrase
MSFIKVKPYTNPRTGRVSWRAYGRSDGKEIRKNFPSQDEADNWAFARNEEASLRAGAVRAATRQYLYTSLTPEEVAIAEAAIERWQGRAGLKEIVEAGTAGLSVSPVAIPVAKLIEDWLTLIKADTGANWYRDLRARCRRFANDNPKLVTTGLTRTFVSDWLDGLELSRVSRAHFRGALSRFFGWLVEKGHLSVNPCTGIKMPTRTKGLEMDAALPAILSAQQARALLHAYHDPKRLPSLGWLVLVLFCGLRPEAEAQRMTWGLVDMKAGELQVMGRKTGASLRTFKVTPQALRWLKHVRALGLPGDMVGINSRAARRGAVIAANEELVAAGLRPIKWEGDICRHTYASVRAPVCKIDDLAREMGTSAEMLHRHYRHPLSGSDVAAFAKVLPWV